MRLILAAGFLVAFGFQAEAKIQICNKFEHPIRVALAFEQNDGWVTDGWIEIDTDKCVLDEKHPNTTSFYYHGESSFGQNRWTWGNAREFSVKDGGFTIRNAERSTEGARVVKFSGPNSHWLPETIVKLQFEPDLKTTFAVPAEKPPLEAVRKVCEHNSGVIAIQACTVLIRNDPNDAKAYSDRGVEYAKIGDYDRAIADYSKAITIRPDFVQAYNNRGVSFLSGKDDPSRAIADYTKAIDLNPRFVYAYLNRSSAYSYIRAYDSALKDFTVAISLNAASNTAFYSRAKAYEALGRKDDAIVDYRQALAIAPDHQQTKDALTRLGVSP